MKLRQIVSTFLSSKDSSSHDFVRVYNLAVFGVQTEFNLDIKGNFKTVLVNVNPNKSAEFPCGAITYNKMGIVNRNGEIATFKRNDKLTNYHQDAFANTAPLAGVPTLPDFTGFNGTSDGVSLYNAYLYLNYNYGNTSFNLFGLGSGTIDIGQYTVDETNRIIKFNPDFIYTTFLFEGLFDAPLGDDDDYEIDTRGAQAMLAYIRWANAVDMPKQFGQSTINALYRAYTNQKRLARMRINPVVLNEMQNAERRSWKLVAKA